nr:5'-methylthioadenosine/adenosylhomocysteine nucleosidase [Paenibacillus turpanensis]
MGKIGLIGAMQEEVERFLPEMSQVQEFTKAGTVYYEGQLRGQHVVLCKCGVGKVNAAVCTQVLIDTYGVEQIIFTGVAGALHPELNIGDIVVSTECMQHDMDVTALGFAKGIIPYAEVSVFPASQQLVEAALRSSEKLAHVGVKQGRVLSGDQFVADRQLVNALHQELGGVCVEMEGAAVAQVCHVNATPYVVIRSMSDKADGSAHVNFGEFTQLASERSYLIVAGMLESL